MYKKMLAPWMKSYDHPRKHIKKQRHYFANKGPSSQSYDFSCSHVWMWELNYKKSWVPRNWCFWTVVLEKTLESPLDCKEIQPFNPKGNQSWIFIGRSDAEAEAPILWPRDAKNWLIGKDFDAGKLKAWGEGDNRGSDGWMALPTPWTWVWANSRSWWWTGKPGMLQSMGLQRVGHGWATEELSWTELPYLFSQKGLCLSLSLPWLFPWGVNKRQRLAIYLVSAVISIFESKWDAAAKSLQSCPTLCDPIDGSPWGCPIPGILQARTLEWVAISFSNAWKWKVKVKSLSHVRLLATPWTAAHQAPPSMGFSRQEGWCKFLNWSLPISCLRNCKEKAG